VQEQVQQVMSQQEYETGKEEWLASHRLIKIVKCCLQENGQINQQDNQSSWNKRYKLYIDKTILVT